MRLIRNCYYPIFLLFCKLLRCIVFSSDTDDPAHRRYSQVNVFLIEPSDDAATLPTTGIAAENLEPFSPPWNLSCLQAFLHKHTRHICHFMDARLMEDVEQALVKRISVIEPPRIVVVNAPLRGLGNVVAILDIVKRHFPAIRTVLCGEFPSSFPEQISVMPRVDFALSGDAEPILRNLLDYIDIPQRLRRTPGLYGAGAEPTRPYWLPRLHGLPSPDWNQSFWTDYKTGIGHGTYRASIRLSRGHSGTREDRAFGEVGQPLRMYPLEAMSQFLVRTAQTPIREVLLTDPPGFWNEAVLADWIYQLLRTRNSQPWGLTMFPHSHHDSLIADLRETQCRRVDILFPSCDREILERYNVRIDWRGLQETIESMQDCGIQVNPRFWVGSPEEPRREGQRIAQVIRRLRLHEYRVEPFPYIIDSAFYREHQADHPQTATLQDWLDWARSPWNKERPIQLWEAEDGLERIKDSIRALQKDLHKSPYILWTRFQRTVLNQNWVMAAEDRALHWLQALKRAK